MAELTVHVDAAPDPQLLRAVIEARLADRAVRPGPEAQVAEAVARAVAAASEGASGCH